MRSTIVVSMCTMNFLLEFDRVMILEKGRIKERGVPLKLLKDEDAILYNEVSEVDPSIIKKLKREAERKKNKRLGKEDPMNPFLSLLSNNSSRKKSDDTLGSALPAQKVTKGKA